MTKQKFYTFIILLLSVVIITLIALYQNEHASLMLYQPFVNAYYNLTKNKIKTIDDDINNFKSSIKEAIINSEVEYNNQICSIFKSDLNSNDLKEQKPIVQKTYDSLFNGDPSEIIYQYVPRNLNDRYGSHAIPLITAGLITVGDILELGIGRYSTPAFNKIAKDQKKFLLSVESELSWMQNFVHLNDTKTHLIISSASKCAQEINMQKRWGVVFVDHLQGEKRYLDMIKYSNLSEIVVAHDSEKQSSGYYGYERAYGEFKYHCKYSLIYPDNSYLSTSLLSNFVNFENIEKILKKTSTHLKHVMCDQSYKKKRK